MFSIAEQNIFIYLYITKQWTHRDIMLSDIMF